MRSLQNISIINALVRITVGFTVIVWATTRLIRKPWRDSYLIMALIGGMKIGQGILRYCPFVAIVDRFYDWEDDELFEEFIVDDDDIVYESE